MHSGKNRLHKARLGLALTAVAALGASMLSYPASGVVNAPHTMIVSMDDSIVLLDGLQIGETVTVSVIRGTVEVGTVTGQAEDLLGNGVGQFEINHAAAPTVCWEGVTPEIVPGDVVRVEGNFPTDDLVVSDIDLLTEVVPAVGGQSFTVRGHINANPLPPISELDVEVRLLGVAGLPSNGRWRTTATEAGNTIVYDPATPGDFVATFTNSENDGPVTPQVIAAAASPIVLEAQHITSRDAAGEITGGTAGMFGGPFGPEDAACPALASRAITTVSPARINAANANADVIVSGVTADAPAGSGAPTVSVTLSDGVDTVTAAPANVVVNGDNTWSARFPGPLASLEGNLAVKATHGPVTGGDAQNTRTLLKDTVRPAAPTVSPNGGAVSGPTSVFLAGGGGDRLHYTVGNGGQPGPAFNSGILFAAPFTVVPGQTVKAIAVDAADNESSTTTASFTQTATPPPVVRPPGGGSAAIIALAPGIGSAKSGKPGGNDTATAKWRAPLANGAVLNGFEVRALKTRPGRSAKIRPAVVVEDRNAKKLQLSLPAGKYRFQVRAFGPAGKSPWSERSNQVRSR